MGLLQRAVETYDANQDRVGRYYEGHEPLAPIGHIITGADIEVTLNQDGKFVSARKVDKAEPKTIIPVSEESGGRTCAPVAHPLCDQLKYILSADTDTYALYVEGLKKWAVSDYQHPFLNSILTYVEGGTLQSDLATCGIVDAYDEKNDGKKMVCWRVINDGGQEPAVWKNTNLQETYIAYYLSQLENREKAVCMVSGDVTAVAGQHPKGIIPVNGNAKLISSNDSNGFTYRGRFDTDRQAASVGYIASQKAHNALRWLASEQGVREFSGNRIYICWNPEGKAIPRPMRSIRQAADPIRKPTDYKEDLKRILWDVKSLNQLKENDRAVFVSFDAATTGRLAQTYFNDISVGQFLQRLQEWDSECCWYNGKYGIQSPSLFQIVEGAYGTQRGNFLEVDDKIQRQHLQRLLDIKINGGVFPADIVKALVQRASSPQSFEDGVWRKLMFTACAVLQKYRSDTKKGGNEMSWDLDKKDRSFQFGRLLAAMERAESDYYYKTNENRQTNAIKNMSQFRRNPWSVFERINRQLNQAYLGRIEQWQKARYERVKDEICKILREFPEGDLNKPLEDTYLMGYEIQRNAFFEKSDKGEE